MTEQNTTKKTIRDKILEVYMSENKLPKLKNLYEYQVDGSGGVDIVFAGDDND